MKGLQFTLPTLLDDGPIIEAEIHTNDKTFISIKNNNGNDTYCSVKLLIDTGSNISGLDTSFIQRLKLKRYKGNAQVDGVGGMHDVKLYRCILYLPIFGERAMPIDVVEGNYNNSPYDGVIGRDVLKYCSFTYDGWSNTFKLIAIDV